MACNNVLPLIRKDPFPHVIPVPCGKCAGCRKDRLTMWQDRVQFEAMTSPRPSSFVTLTFDEPHLNHDPCVHKSEMQNFLKRFRKQLYEANERKPVYSIQGISSDKPAFDKFRYFQTSEYGDKTFRKHYHMCVTNFDSYDRYDFDALYKAWSTDDFSNPIGNIVADTLIPARIRYCIEYISFETKAQIEAYKALGLTPLFHSMSKGIGADWIFAHADMIRESNGYYSEGTLRPLSPYYKLKLGMTEKYEYLNQLNDMWNKYNGRLKLKGFAPIDPTNLDDMYDRGLFDQLERGSKRSVLQSLCADDAREIGMVSKEILRKSRPRSLL